MTKRFGVVGSRHGHIQSFIKEMLEKGYECAGIHDPDDWKLARKYAEQFGISLVERVEVLLNPSVQIIGSSAINSQKIDLIEACERNGQHIVLDKPAVTDRDGLRRLEEVVRRNRIVIGLMLPKRFWGALTALKREIDGGRLGQVVHIDVSSPHKLTPAARDDWHFSKKQNGGVLIDLLIHDTDLIRWLTGRDIAHVQGVMTKSILPEYPDFYDVAGVQAVMDDGTTAQLYADWHTPNNNKDGRFSRIVVTGTEGWAEYAYAYDAGLNKEHTHLRITRGDDPDQQGQVISPDAQTVTSVGDFLDRTAGLPGTFTHADIVAASRATIEADERAIVRNRFAK